MRSALVPAAGANGRTMAACVRTVGEDEVIPMRHPAIYRCYNTITFGYNPEFRPREMLLPL